MVVCNKFSDLNTQDRLILRLTSHIHHWSIGRHTENKLEKNFGEASAYMELFALAKAPLLKA